jgi:hypothetical protein
VLVAQARLVAQAGLPPEPERAQGSRAGARGHPAGRAASAGGGRLPAARVRTPGGVARTARAKVRDGRRRTDRAGERARHRRTRHTGGSPAAVTNDLAGRRDRVRRPTDRAWPARARHRAGHAGPAGHRRREFRGQGPALGSAVPAAPPRETSRAIRETDRAPRAPGRAHRGPDLALRELYRATGQLDRARKPASRVTAVSVPKQGPASGARHDPPGTPSAGALEPGPQRPGPPGPRRPETGRQEAAAGGTETAAGRTTAGLLERRPR